MKRQLNDKVKKPIPKTNKSYLYKKDYFKNLPGCVYYLPLTYQNQISPVG